LEIDLGSKFESSVPSQHTHLKKENRSFRSKRGTELWVGEEGKLGREALREV
tara:strand:- start:1044 stop:1199 length:156 start_codon:yes stop_codon:yes gene_type:complete